MEAGKQGGQSFVGPDAISAYRLVTLRHAAGLYLRTGIMAGRSWTPQNMRNAIGAALGTEYPRSRRGLEQAHRDLSAALDALAAEMDAKRGTAPAGWTEVQS